MTRPEVMREAIVSLRQAEREEPRETVADAVKAFLVLALIVCAFYAAALVVASFAVMYR
jgi:amino acid permease